VSRIRADIRVDAADRIEPGVWWYSKEDSPLLPHAFGWVSVHDGEFRVTGSAAALRRLSAAFAAAAEQVDRAYAEHGVEPPQEAS
jgi:hypothetical protein